MSAYYLNLVAINPKREEIRSEPVRVVVDTGSELSWMPAEVLAKTGIQPRRKRVFAMADGHTMEREVGFCMHLLGVRTLEGFGVMVDALAHRLVVTTTLAAPGARTALK